MEVDPKIIEKYDQPGPRYTSYPPATQFRQGFTESEYLKAVDHSNQLKPRGISLYVHIPFCPRLCHFCGCNTQVGRDALFIERYFDALIREIDRLAEHMDRERPVTQIHWGGGTPNSVEISLIEKIMDRFKHWFKFSEDPEIAMECSPAYLDLDDINLLSKMGFNRISLGIQDFNEDVLRIINRKPSKLPVEQVVEHIHQTTNARVNLDFVYGLPGQTLDTYLETLQKATDIRPDRLVTFSYAHVPWVKENQKILEKSGIPGPDLKMKMLLQGYDLIKGAGYEAIGMDHFALPGDEMAEAFQSRELHRNFQGYCTRKHTGQVYAFGASAITQLQHAYIQNLKDAKAYMDYIESGKLPVEKGYILNEKEQIIRQVINQLMCNGQLDLDQEAGKIGMKVNELKELLDYSHSNIAELELDGLLHSEGNKITATAFGMLLIRVIARELDPEYTSYGKKFSKTI
jgi:oxygen-independent coproporphyrinogen-3 oxidase